jgi:hypothetical protein
MRITIAILGVLLLSGCASESTGWWINSNESLWEFNEGNWLDSKGWDAPSSAEAANDRWFKEYYDQDKGCNIHGC